MRSDLRSAWRQTARLACVCGLLAMSGCFLPEIDTPPIDPSLVPDESSGGGGGVDAPACKAGTFKGNLFLNDVTQPGGYDGECSIQGNVTETWKTKDSPTELLAMTRSIQGRLTIKAGQDDGSKMTILPALQNVKELIISGVPLTHAPSFPSLSQITLGLTIENNYRMQTIPGFANLRQVGTLRIYGMSKLTSVPTFAKLEDIGGDVTVQHNTQLKGIAFPGAGTFSGNLVFDGNTNMTSVDLGGATFAGSVTVSNQPKTTSVRALKLIQISNLLKIADNGDMTSDMLNFPLLTTLKAFELRNQPKIGHLNWIGQGKAPKLHNLLTVCKSGVSYAQAAGFFGQAGSTFQEGSCALN